MNRHGAKSTKQASTSPEGNAEVPADEWTQHEHVADRAKIEAQRLVDAVGTPELAKQAVDAATSDPATNKEELATKLGFVSYLEMFEASMAVRNLSGQSYFVTCDREGKWLVWNERMLDNGKRFATREDAENSVRAVG
jgi:hypothetical protein